MAEVKPTTRVQRTSWGIQRLLEVGPFDPVESFAPPLLIPDVECAAMVGVSRTCWHKLPAAGKIPPVIKLGRKALWRRQEIEAWIVAGCPNGETWAAMQAAAARTD